MRTVPSSQTPQTALVTGASSGIGLELAMLLAASGHNLVLVARDAAALERVATSARAMGVTAHVLPLDLATPGAVEELMSALAGDAATSQIDILINNAGYALYGSFLETDPADEARMLHLNIVTLTALTKRLLPGMVARGHGRVLNLASTAAFLPGPRMAVYFATKAYVLSFSEALAEELRASGSGVTVTVLCPGPTATGFQRRAGLGASRLFGGGTADAKQVAQAGFNAMMKGQVVVVPGLTNRLLLGGSRLIPRVVLRRITRRLLAPK